MKVVAHRGACTEALENTWEAFRKAVELGADRIELDVHLTADNHIVILHDEDFRRTAGLDKTLRQLTRKEIESTIKLSNGEGVPFLDEVSEDLLDKIELNVEIKALGPAIVDAVGKLYEGHRFADKVIISSFNRDTCAWSATKFPKVKVALLWDKYLWLPGSFQLGPVRFMKKHGIRIYHPEAKLLTPSMMKTARAEGIDVVPYVGLRDETNREQLWSYLMTVGVQGLCTNYPRAMKLWLQEARDDETRYANQSLGNQAPKI
ncbi:MAG: glycerophosphodiester phosphodiesterase family protein [Bdellovibrionota bacterium]